MADSPKQKVREFHALGVARVPGKAGFVVVKFTVSGDRVLNAELVSPEAQPEPKPFAARRLLAQASKLIDEAARE